MHLLTASALLFHMSWMMAVNDRCPRRFENGRRLGIKGKTVIVVDLRREEILDVFVRKIIHPDNWSVVYSQNVKRENWHLLAAARTQRLSVILSSYEYTVEYRNSSNHANADVWSTLATKCTTRQSTCVSSEMNCLFW